MTRPANQFMREVALIHGPTIKPEPVTWLWPDWLAAGKLHMLGGAPGTGKTTIALALAATITVGGQWPDGTRARPGKVLIWSGEDEPADVLVPRLMASGANLENVYFVGQVREGNQSRPFDPACDVVPLSHAAIEIGDIALMIVDPIVSAIAGDSHKNSEVRRGLQPLVDLAANLRCALLGITHFSKGTGGREPVERLTGSLAFGALARVVFVAAKTNAEDGESAGRIFMRAKSNIGRDEGGFAYDLHQTEAAPGVFASHVQWIGNVEGTAREMLATAEASTEDGEGGTLADAKRFLADLLADGPMPVKAIKSDADGAGYSWATIRRAQFQLGIEARKEMGTRHGGWVWALSSQGVHPLPTQNLERLGHLEQLVINNQE